MRQRFRARELWMFAPFLLIGLAALLYWRWEQVAPADERGMHVSDVTIDAAPGRYQKFGRSHRVTITISHPWPRPKWWGQNYNSSEFINAPGYTRQKPSQRKALAPNVLANGEAVTYQEGAKTREPPGQFGGGTNNFRFDGTNYVSVDYFDLNNAPAKWGALTLHGAYAIAGQPVLAFKREIRKPGASLAIPLNKDAGAQLVSVDASDFYARMSKYPDGIPKPRETCSLRFIVRNLGAPAPSGQKPGLMVEALELRDETGKKFAFSPTAGLEQTWGALNDAQMKSDDAFAQSLRADETDSVTHIDLAPTFQTKGRLTLRGQISVDDRWPMPFQLTLPPRVAKPAPASEFIQFSNAPWRDGAPVKAR